MAHGRVVFDGTPAQMTRAVTQQIYGDDTDPAVDENLTSTMASIGSAIAADARQLEAAL